MRNIQKGNIWCYQKTHLDLLKIVVVYLQLISSKIKATRTILDANSVPLLSRKYPAGSTNPDSVILSRSDSSSKISFGVSFLNLRMVSSRKFCFASSMFEVIWKEDDLKWVLLKGHENPGQWPGTWSVWSWKCWKKSSPIFFKIASKVATHLGYVCKKVLQA